MVMDALENEERQTQVFDNQENIIKEIRGTDIYKEDAYDSVCPYGGCG